MTNEKMLEKLYEVKQRLTEEQKSGCEFVTNTGLDFNSIDKNSIFDGNAGAYVQMLINNLKAEIKEEAFKNNGGNKDVLKYAKAMLKNCKKIIPSRPVFHYPDYQNFNGIDYQVICNSFLLIAMENHIVLEEKPEKVTGDFLKIEKVYNGNVSEEIELPDIKDLDTYIKCRKAENKTKGKNADKNILVDLDTNLNCIFNAEFLQIAMHCLGGDCKMFICGRCSYLLKSNKDNSFALLMGITPNNEIKVSRIKTEF